MSIQPASSEDIFLWPDGTRCFRHEYDQGHYQQMSDDFEIVPEGTARYDAVLSDGETSIETSEADARPYVARGLAGGIAT